MPAENYTTRVNDFFNAYEARFRDSLAGKDDVNGTAEAFADCFLEANPFGVTCGENDAQFKEMIAKGNDHYRQTGTKEMRVLSVESSATDQNHYMATVNWHSVYEKKDGTMVPIDFAVTYLLQDINNSLKIFTYITGDEEGVLKEKGIL